MSGSKLDIEWIYERSYRDMCERAMKCLESTLELLESIKKQRDELMELATEQNKMIKVLRGDRYSSELKVDTQSPPSP